MQIVRFNTLNELQPYAQAWDHLAAGVPFRGWTWLSTWWRHYGEDSNAMRPKRELFVLAVFDDGDMLVGLRLGSSNPRLRSDRWRKCSDRGKSAPII